MLRALVLLTVVLGGPAHAGGPAPEPTPAERQAEGRRLSDEIARAGTAGNWKAVERHMGTASSRDVPLTAGALVLGAEAARSRGELGLVRERLVAALAVEPAHAVAGPALADLDARFGRVDLQAPLGSTLEDYAHPFDPVAVRAVDLAIAEVARTGAFRGLLPPGEYSIDGDPFEVVAGQEVRLDLGSGVALPPDRSLATGRR